MNPFDLTVTECPNFQILDVKLNKQIAVDDLQTLIIPKFDTDKGIIISGPLTLWFTGYLLQNIKTNSWLAVFDPRFGAVVIKGTQQIAPLKIIPKDEIKPFLQRSKKQANIIAVVGPPQTGKTVFLFSLFKKILDLDYTTINQSAMILKGCPDGEGRWCGDVDPDLVKIIRYKNEFTEDFVTFVINQIAAFSELKSLLFIDCGGKISEENRKILSACTSVIILGKNPQDFINWRAILDLKKGIKIIAEITSTMDEIQDNLYNLEPDGVIRITLSKLSRENQNIIIPEAFLKFIKTLA